MVASAYEVYNSTSNDACIRAEDPERQTMSMMSRLFLLVSAVVIVAAHHEEPQQLRAIVLLADPPGKGIKGNITFTELSDGKVHVQGSLYGLPAGQYGFHVHEKGDITGGCLSTGAHYNPEHKDHGHPNDDNRHVGDLGNVVFDENQWSIIDFVDSVIALRGSHCIIGRAVVLHEKGDDFGRSDHPDSKKTGNAGGRVACGVIGILSSNSCCGRDSAVSVVSSFWYSTVLAVLTLCFIV